MQSGFPLTLKPRSPLRLRSTPSTSKWPNIKYFRSYCLYCNSALILWKQPETIVNEWVGMCLNKTSFTKTEEGWILPKDYCLPAPALFHCDFNKLLQQSQSYFMEDSHTSFYDTFSLSVSLLLGLLWWLSGKESTCQCRRRVHPWVRKSTWRRKWQATPVSLPGKFHGQRSLVGYSPWGCKTVRHNLETKHQSLLLFFALNPRPFDS